MADGNQFKVILGADSSQLQTALNDAFKSVQDFSIKVGKLPQPIFSTLGIDNYRKAVGQLKAEVGAATLQPLINELKTLNTEAARTSLKNIQVIIDGNADPLKAALAEAKRGIEKARAEKVIIDADTAPLTAKLTAVTRDVQDFGNALKRNTAVPISFNTQGIDNYRQSVTQLKSELTTVKFTHVVQGLLDVDNASKKLNPANAIALANGIEVLANKITGAVSSITIGSDSLLQLTAAVNQATSASLAAGQGFLALGTKVPTAQIENLSVNVAQLKADLAGGFKPIINLVDPKIPPLLNSVNASLANFSPIAAQASAAAAATFASFQKLGGVRLPLEDVNKLKASVAQLKADLATGGKTFTIDTKSATNSLNFLTNQLKTLKEQLNRSTDPAVIVRLNKAIADTSVKIKGLNTATVSAGRSLSSIKPGANAAGLALTDFSRILQDIPFGIQGVANNLNPMIDSFARAKAATGSTVGALKGMASSLMGPAGIGLAIAAVSSAFIIFQNGISGFNKKTKEAADKTKEFNDTLRSTDDIVNEAFGSVQGQISNVNALADAVRDSTKPYAERQRALEDLQKTNKAYFGDLTLEANSLSTLTGKVNEYTKALVAGAVVKGFTDEITKVSQELFKQNTLVDQARDKMKRLQAVSDNIKPFDQVIGGSSLTAGTTVERYTKKQLAAIEATRVATAEFDALNAQGDKLGGTFAVLESKLDDAVGKTLKLASLDPAKGATEGVKKSDEIIKALKNELDGVNDRIAVSNKLRQAGKLAIFQETQALNDQLKSLEILDKIDQREVQIGVKPKLEIDPNLTALEVSELYEEYSKRTKAAFALPLQVDPNIKVGPISFTEKLAEAFKKQQALKAQGIDVPLEINIQPESNITEVFDKIQKDLGAVRFDNAFRPMVASMQTSAANAKAQIETGIVAEFSKIDIEDALTGAISGIGEGLGKAISEGQNPFIGAAESFLHILGSVIDQFGKKIIALGVAMLAAKNAIKVSFSNPAVAIAAGAALSILGGLLKNVKFNAPQFAEGGIASGPRSGYLAMLHGTEMITPIDKVGKMMGGGANIIAGDWVIKGTDLVFIQKETLKKRGRM